MARKVIGSVRKLAEEKGFSPAEYLLNRCKHAYNHGDHETCIRLSLELLPYVARKMAPQPAEAIEQAAKEGRLVVIGIPDTAE